MIELPVDQVALHEVHVAPADSTAAARDVPALRQDPSLWGNAVGEQAARISQAGESSTAQPLG